jgi:hypothetical protein
MVHQVIDVTIVRQPFDSTDEDEESDATDESGLTDLPESEDELSLPVAKIPKPPGEAGRKNSGGFNLQEVLGWNDDKYKKFMVSYAFLLTTFTHQSKRNGSQMKQRRS